MVMVTPNAKNHETSRPCIPLRGCRVAAVDTDALQGRRYEVAHGGQGDRPVDGARQICARRYPAGPSSMLELEQTCVLEGSLEDHEGAATVGNYVWRPAGSRQSCAPKGCLALSFFFEAEQLLRYAVRSTANVQKPAVAAPCERCRPRAVPPVRALAVGTQRASKRRPCRWSQLEFLRQ